MKWPGYMLAVMCCLTSFSHPVCPSVKVLQATVRHWTSGAPGGRNGNQYTIKVKLTTASNVAFTHVWLGTEEVPFNLERFALETNQPLQQGDSLLLTYNRINGEPDQVADPKRLPIDYDGAACVEYLVNGKARYLIVKTFTALADMQGE